MSKEAVAFKTKIARKIWKKIMEDFSDRRGIKQMFDGRTVGCIEKSIMRELKATNIKHIESVLEDSFGLP